MAPVSKNMAAADDSDSETELVMADADEGRELEHTEEGDEESSEADDSDMDVSEQRRQDALEQMSRIEKEFSELKDRLYQEKLHSVDTEIDQIATGTHPDFTESVQQLEHKKEERLKMADMWRTCQMDVIEAAYRMEKVGAETDYANEVQLVRERLISALQEKKRRLDEEKGSADIVAELASDHGSRLAPLRNLRRRGAGVEPVETKLAKKKIVSGPHFVPQLKESEILEDLLVISRANPAVATRRAAAVIKDAREKEDDVVVEGGAVLYQGNRYERGNHIIIENKTESGRFTATITGISNTELSVQRTDGSKTKLPLQHLRQGKFTIRLKS